MSKNNLTKNSGRSYTESVKAMGNKLPNIVMTSPKNAFKPPNQSVGRALRSKNF